MATSHGPSVLRRRLAAELRRLREQAGLTGDEVAERLGWSGSKVSRAETSRRGIKPKDVQALLEVYEVSEADKEALIELTRKSRRKGWWHAHGDAVPDWFESYVGLEVEASELRNYEAELVPGLLQTDAYARAIHRAVRVSDPPEEIERLVAVRMARQALLTKESAPRLWAVVNEAVLRRQVGGPKVMRDQLQYLTEAAELPNLALQVVPFTAGAHAAMVGSFMMLRFPELTDADVIYVENQTGSLYLEKPEEADRYRLTFDHMMAKAIDPDESQALIARVAKELE